MSGYKECIYPAKYNNISKEKLFNEFINLNMFVWRTPALYSKKIFEALKPSVCSEDSNQITWWKLWYKTLILVSEIYNLTYLESTASKIYETLPNHSNEDLAKLLLELNLILITRVEFSLFGTIEGSIRAYGNKTVPQGLMKVYKNREKISQIIKNNIPASALDKTILKTVLGTEFLKTIEELDYPKLIREFLFREAYEEGDLKKEHFLTVMNSFVISKYKKENPQLFINMWNDIDNIINKPKEDKGQRPPA